MSNRDFPASFLDTLARAALDRDGKPERNEIRFRCPAEGHEDRHPSARWNPEKATWFCDVCKAGGGALDLAERLGIPAPRQGGGGPMSGKSNAQAHTLAGCTIAEYATAKALPESFLRSLGLQDVTYLGSPAVRIPYPDENGNEDAVRFRVAMTGKERFRWRKGSKPGLYGRDRRTDALALGEAMLPEGESDAQTFWHYDIPAFGLPGAGMWNDDRMAPFFDGIERIYVPIEPDAGGETLQTTLARSRIRDRVHLVDFTPYGVKDANALHVLDPARFREHWETIKGAAIALADLDAKERRAEADAAWIACRAYAESPDILARFGDDLARRRVAGERRAAKVLYLAFVSRLLDRPVSVTVKGPSSAGKSHLVEKVAEFFPSENWFALSAMSERALAYSEEPMSHRILIIYEAAGLAGDFASYLMRSLLSEGRIRYETVEKTKDGMRARLIEREGPTGLILTTTAVHIHPENETRMLSIPVTDTPDQTRLVFRAIADETARVVNFEPWHALQTWLAYGERGVTIPFADALADRVAAIAVRLRRDFGLLLTMIRAHALLHRAGRDRNMDGMIVATLADYAAIRSLIGDLIADGVDATVPETVRETVEAVRTLLNVAAGIVAGDRTVSVREIAVHLKLDRSAASRRVTTAIDRGYLRNLEEKRGRPARIALGDAFPTDTQILPSPEELCSRADETYENTATPPDGTSEDAIPESCRFGHICGKRGPCPGLWCVQSEAA